MVKKGLKFFQENRKTYWEVITDTLQQLLFNWKESGFKSASFQWGRTLKLDENVIQIVQIVEIYEDRKANTI